MDRKQPKKDLSPFVFLDPSGKRWPRLRMTLLLLGVAIFLSVVWFIQALFVRPELRLPSSVRKLKGQLKALQQQQNAQPQNPAKLAPWQKFYPKSQAAVERIAKLREQLHENPQKKISEIRLGFCVADDQDSYQSLEKHASQLTHVCTDWLTVIDGTGTLHAEEDLRVEKLAASKGLILMPMLDNLVENTWKPEAVENLATGPADRQNKFIITLLSRLEEAKAGGVVIDLEQLDPVYQKQISDFLKKIADALHAVDKQLWLVVPMGDEMRAYDLETLSDSVDYFIAQLFDENSNTDDPGPIASQDWLEGWLALISSYGNPDQWIGTIGAYGYDWSSGSKKAEVISFSDAMSRASYAGTKKVELQGPSYNPLFSYQEPAGNHTVCFLDAITFLNHLRAIRSEKLGGIAINKLGTEDPGIWDVLGFKDAQNLNPAAVNRLKLMKSSDTVTNVGQGEIVTVDDTQDNGFRDVKLDSTNRYTATYDGTDPDPAKGFPT
ncbi:MAG: glycosyl hydrolase family 18 protein, partial [Verrucomicrobiota bacterium]